MITNGEDTTNMEPTTTTPNTTTTDPSLTAAHAVIMADRVRNLLTEEPQFLPHFISLMGYCNRQLAKIERAKVCTEDPRYAQPTQLEKTLIKAGASKGSNIATA